MNSWPKIKTNWRGKWFLVHQFNAHTAHTYEMKLGTKLQKKKKKKNRDANAFKRFAIISTFIFMKFVYVCQPKRQKINKYVCNAMYACKNEEKMNMANCKGNTLCGMERKNERVATCTNAMNRAIVYTFL